MDCQLSTEILIFFIFFLLSAGSTPSLPGIGLDVAMKELDQLDGELDILETNKENNALLSEDVFMGKLEIKLEFYLLRLNSRSSH